MYWRWPHLLFLSCSCSLCCLNKLTLFRIIGTLPQKERRVKIHPRPQRADAGSGKRRRLALLMNESNTVVKAKITTKRYRFLDTWLIYSGIDDDYADVRSIAPSFTSSLTCSVVYINYSHVVSNNDYYTRVFPVFQQITCAMIIFLL